MIRYFSHFTLDPEYMTDDEFAKVWGQLEFALKQTGQYNNG